MFISLADANGTWVVFYEERSLNPRRVACWALREYQNGGKRKILPVVHGEGGKLVDANSVGKIAALLAGKLAQERMTEGQTGKGDTMPAKSDTDIAPPGQPDPVPPLEDEDDED